MKVIEREERGLRKDDRKFDRLTNRAARSQSGAGRTRGSGKPRLREGRRVFNKAILPRMWSDATVKASIERYTLSTRKKDLISTDSVKLISGS